jgi:antitoxin ParD1/3/4
MIGGSGTVRIRADWIRLTAASRRAIRVRWRAALADAAASISRAPSDWVAANPPLGSHVRRNVIEMNITIPKSLEGLVREKVVEGRYSSEEEVVADALRLMQARDAAVEIKRARLKDAIDRGYDDVAAGRVTALDSDDQIDAFFADL